MLISLLDNHFNDINLFVVNKNKKLPNFTQAESLESLNMESQWYTPISQFPCCRLAQWLKLNKQF